MKLNNIILFIIIIFYILTLPDAFSNDCLKQFVSEYGTMLDIAIKNNNKEIIDLLIKKIGKTSLTGESRLNLLGIPISKRMEASNGKNEKTESGIQLSATNLKEIGIQNLSGHFVEILEKLRFIGWSENSKIIYIDGCYEAKLYIFNYITDTYEKKLNIGDYCEGCTGGIDYKKVNEFLENEKFVPINEITIDKLPYIQDGEIIDAYTKGYHLFVESKKLGHKRIYTINYDKFGRIVGFIKTPDSDRIIIVFQGSNKLLLSGSHLKKGFHSIDKDFNRTYRSKKMGFSMKIPASWSIYENHKKLNEDVYSGQTIAKLSDPQEIMVDMSSYKKSITISAYDKKNYVRNIKIKDPLADESEDSYVTQEITDFISNRGLKGKIIKYMLPGAECINDYYSIYEIEIRDKILIFTTYELTYNGCKKVNDWNPGLEIMKTIRIEE